jgi:hypothetical protein
MPHSLARFLHPLTILLVSILVLLAEQSLLEQNGKTQTGSDSRKWSSGAMALNGLRMMPLFP